MARRVRIPEEEWLARPDLWTPDGLADYLREHGIDPGQPYRQDESAEAGGWLFVQEPAAEPVGACGGRLAMEEDGRR